MEFKVNITINALNVNEAKRTGKLLQTIANTTDTETKNYLCEKTEKDPNFFRKIAKQLKNPIVKKFFT